MKNIFLSLLFLQTFMLATVVASPEDNTNCIVSTSVETNGYRFIVCVTNGNPQIGGAIVVHTTLENISTNNVEVVLASPLHNNKITVIRDTKEVIQMTSYGRRSTLAEISVAKRMLNHGETITESFPVNRFFEMSKVGDYEITISRRIRIDKSEWGTITAPPLKIRLKKG